jgi:hypothetical protein
MRLAQVAECQNRFAATRERVDPMDAASPPSPAAGPKPALLYGLPVRLLDRSVTAVAVSGLDGRLEYVNAALLALLGHA